MTEKQKLLPSQLMLSLLIKYPPLILKEQLDQTFYENDKSDGPSLSLLTTKNMKVFGAKYVLGPPFSSRVEVILTRLYIGRTIFIFLKEAAHECAHYDKLLSISHILM